MVLIENEATDIGSGFNSKSHCKSISSLKRAFGAWLRLRKETFIELPERFRQQK